MNVRGNRRQNTESAIELTGICKEFDGRHALIDASLQVHWGEVHALLGENGAGKSTLVNVALGLYAPDSGTIAVNGEEATITQPGDAAALGIGMVHQHFKLVSQFTVAENILLSCGPHLGISSTAEANRIIAEKSRAMNLEVDPDAVIDEISIAEQQRVEILKMLLIDARILILDEPTAVLTDKESQSVLSLLRDMVATGCAVVLITHKLREVLEFSDRVTVMRAGKTVMRDESTKGQTRESLAIAMVGTAASRVDRGEIQLGRKLYAVDGIQVADSSGAVGVAGVSFSVRAGEIYGIAGVGGNGQPQLANALMGLSQVTAGSVTVNGKDITHSTVLERRRLGLRFIPSNRYRGGMISDMLAYENFGMTRIHDDRYGKWLRVHRREMKKTTTAAIDTYQILGCLAATRTSLLSGGNAQKLLLARELQTGLSVIVAHSPTRGLDVQACNFVHGLLLQAAEQGAACLLISEDLEEILSLASKVAVMSRGRLVGEFSAAGVSRERIGELMLG